MPLPMWGDEYTSGGGTKFTAANKRSRDRLRNTSARGRGTNRNPGFKNAVSNFGAKYNSPTNKRNRFIKSVF